MRRRTSPPAGSPCPGRPGPTPATSSSVPWGTGTSELAASAVVLREVSRSSIAAAPERGAGVTRRTEEPSARRITQLRADSVDLARRPRTPRRAAPWSTSRGRPRRPRHPRRRRARPWHATAPAGATRSTVVRDHAPTPLAASAEPVSTTRALPVEELEPQLGCPEMMMAKPLAPYSCPARTRVGARAQRHRCLRCRTCPCAGLPDRCARSSSSSRCAHRRWPARSSRRGGTGAVESALQRGERHGRRAWATASSVQARRGRRAVVTRDDDEGASPRRGAGR